MEETNVNISPGKIYAAIAGVMKDVGVVAKEKEFESPIGKKGNYMFRGIDDVMNALHPAMVSNKVFVVPEILEQTRETRTSKSGTQMQVSICKIQYTFFAEDGSSVTAIVIGEGMDTGDKATNKAMSIAFKYACFQVFCIPTEEMQDPDAERPELEDDKTQPKKGNKKSSTKGNQQKEESKKKEESEPDSGSKITEPMLRTIKSEQMRTGVSDKQILSMKVVKAKSIEELTVLEYKAVMDKFQKTPDLKGDKKNE